MCGRYTLTSTKNIEKRFAASNKLNFEKSYNISPGSRLPVVTRNSPNELRMMKWGFVPPWGKENNFSLINIRIETAIGKPYFKSVLMGSRCLVPADGFYEWKSMNLEGKEEKFPFYIFLANRSIFSFAGLYSELIDAEGKSHYSFAILTCPPNQIVNKVHNRMPVILKKSDEDEWLDGKNNNFKNLKPLLKPYPGKQMRMYPVSKDVNNPINDGEKLVKKITRKFT